MECRNPLAARVRVLKTFARSGSNLSEDAYFRHSERRLRSEESTRSDSIVLPNYAKLVSSDSCKQPAGSVAMEAYRSWRKADSGTPDKVGR